MTDDLAELAATLLGIITGVLLGLFIAGLIF